MRNLVICVKFIIIFNLNSFGQETKLVVNKESSKYSNAKEEYYVLKSDKKIKHGSYKKYNPQGNVIIEGFYNYDVKDSFWKFYNYNGKIQSKGTFKNDVKINVWEYFSYKGEIEHKYNHSTKKLEYFKKPDNDKPFQITVLRNNDSVLIEAENPALFIEGMAINQFFIEKIRYPFDAVENEIQGTVYISIIIDENGKIKNYRPVSNLGFGLEEESMRVIKLLPDNWTPAIVDGKPVESVIKIPIKFVLAG